MIAKFCMVSYRSAGSQYNARTAFCKTLIKTRVCGYKRRPVGILSDSFLQLEYLLVVLPNAAFSSALDTNFSQHRNQTSKGSYGPAKMWNVASLNGAVDVGSHVNPILSVRV